MAIGELPVEVDRALIEEQIGCLDQLIFVLLQSPTPHLVGIVSITDSSGFCTLRGYSYATTLQKG